VIVVGAVYLLLVGGVAVVLWDRTFLRRYRHRRERHRDFPTNPNMW
jgi:hypothetical protein